MSARTPTLLMFMTTSGHYGCQTIYRATLDWIDRQLPLSQWGSRVCHIKAKPGHEPILEVMKGDLQRRGFIVESAVADWSRGQSHFTECLKDQIKMSQHPAVYGNPLVYVTDDDYLPTCHVDSFPKVLHRMCQLVEGSPEVLTARFLRAEDQDDLAPHRVVEIEPGKQLAWVNNTNWQPQVMRSRDFYLMGKVIEDNWSIASQMHGEALWRSVLDRFSRSPYKHAVWLKHYAECVNLGVPSYAEVAQRFNLSIAPNPV